MISKLNIEAALASTTKGEEHIGVVCVSDYIKKIGGTGRPYISGNLIDGPKKIGFKVWSDKIDDFEKAINENQIINFKGTIDTYNGISSLVLTYVEAYVGPLENPDFVEGLDEKVVEKAFWAAINENKSNPSLVTILEKIINDEEVNGRFFKEYAAKSMHDNIPGGLANHTTKMLNIFKAISENNSFWYENRDLLTMGIAVHDLGKVIELYNGKYTKNSFLSHIYHGIRIVEKYKDEIIANFDEDFYTRLISIIIGHHDQYETPAKTVYAMIVHMIDNLDAKSTGFAEKVNSELWEEDPNGDKTVSMGSEKLKI